MSNNNNRQQQDIFVNLDKFEIIQVLPDANCTGSIVVWHDGGIRHNTHVNNYVVWERNIRAGVGLIAAQTKDQ